jgi:hypothetical protein
MGFVQQVSEPMWRRHDLCRARLQAVPQSLQFQRGFSRWPARNVKATQALQFVDLFPCKDKGSQAGEAVSPLDSEQASG